MTPIVGSALIRYGSQLPQFFDTDLDKSMPYSSRVFVPIDLPASFEKFLKSAAKRALGPAGDSLERSGVEFQIRTIGARCDEENQQEGDDRQSDDDDDEVTEVPAVSAVPDCPIDVMTSGQMKAAFGRDALSFMGAMFQHQSKIGEQAKFLAQDNFVKLAKSNGKSATYRKSQVDTTVVFSAAKSCLRCSAQCMYPNDCFVQVCGGTPEGIVAAVLLGFQHIIYVAGNEQEQSAMKIPTKKDEAMHNIRYSEYASPNVDNPEEGGLLAAAVRMLAPYIKNFVLDTPGTHMVPPPYDIQLPALRVYTFVQVTGRVLARTVGASDPIRAELGSSESIESTGSEPPAKKRKTVAGPGSSSGKVPPTTTSTRNVDEEEEEEEDDEEEDADAEEGEDDNNDDDDLAKLESIEEEMKSTKRPRRPKGSKGPKGKKPKTSQA